MTQQELFEADYLAAFPKGTESLRKVDGNYIEPCVRLMTLVHEQQAKRHDAEIAELVTMYRKAARHAILCPLMYGDDTPKNHCTCGLEATIAKYEVKK